MVAFAYVYFLNATQFSWNGNSRMALVKSIVEDKSFQIDTFVARDFETGDKAYYDGHYYSDKAIGSALWGALIYWPIAKLSSAFGFALRAGQFKQLMTWLAICLPTAILAPLIYSVAKQISGSRIPALLIAVVICLGTPIYKYATVYMSHSLVAMLAFATFYIWFRVRNSHRADLLTMLLSGFCMGLIIITEYPGMLIVLLLCVYVLYVLWEYQRLADWRLYPALFVGGLIPVSLLLLYNYVIFGNPLSIGYFHEASSVFQADMSKGIGGIGFPDLHVLWYTTLHPSMGFFWQSPVLLLTILGWSFMLRDRRYRPEGLLSLVIILSYTIILSGYYLWWGGQASTPRFLIPMLAFFALPLSFVPRTFRGVFFILVGVSLLEMLAMTAGSNYRLQDVLDLIIPNGASGGKYLTGIALYHPVIYDVYIRNVLAGQLTPNLVSYLSGLSGPITLLPLITVEGILVLLFVHKRPALRSEFSVDGPSGTALTHPESAGPRP